MQETILSVGIDIGTSTTQLIFSRLTIENLASNYTVPRISIVNKEVFYRSGIYFTPLKSQTEIDAAKVKEIIRKEYEKAGRKPEDLQTGAVIITGETARKQNANRVLETLSDMAGDFVVATAGPDLESVLSAKGAGSDRLSEEKREVVANIDIGGGTSNIAFFIKAYQRARLVWILADGLSRWKTERFLIFSPVFRSWQKAMVFRFRWATVPVKKRCTGFANTWPSSLPWLCT